MGFATKNDGLAHNDSRVKAEILNQQFTSVFTTEDDNTPLPKQGHFLLPQVSDISVNTVGIAKLLSNWNLHKATGPDDEISSRFMKETAVHIAPPLSLLFQASLDQGTIPNDWNKANITLLFSKGDGSTLSNYRHVSATSVCSNVLAHIVHSHIIGHMDRHSILTNV